MLRRGTALFVIGNDVAYSTDDAHEAQPARRLPALRELRPFRRGGAGSRLLFVSGLNRFEPDGETIPPDFESQAELIWSNLEAILRDAGMTISDLVSLRFYLAEPALDPMNVAILKRRLGDHHAARTVVCAGLLEPVWLVEIEAIAAAT